MRFTSLIISTVLLSACASVDKDTKPQDENLFLKSHSFASLPGWEGDYLNEALPALQKSCDKATKKKSTANFGAGGFAGTVADWKDVCIQIPTAFVTDTAARSYFEKNFTPYQIRSDKGYEGLFTGYYEPMLHGSYEKKSPFLTPLYTRPDNMITVHLGDFKDDLKGKSITGRVEGQRFIPYYNRTEIENGVLNSETPDKEKSEIVWVDDPIDAFFLHIQGSGQVVMEDGSILRVGYAAQNGHAYYAIGRELIKREAITKENISMQSIRAWLETHPGQAAEIMNLNESYVFFRRLNDDAAAADGPLGAQGVSLTPHRSLAVDRKKIPYGAPIWLDIEAPSDTKRIQRLMIAQDTGGAIRGAVRGDVFWGAGEVAADMAGKMKSKGEAYILLPNTIKIPKDKRWSFWRGIF